MERIDGPLRRCQTRKCGSGRPPRIRETAVAFTEVSSLQDLNLFSTLERDEPPALFSTCHYLPARGLDGSLCGSRARRTKHHWQGHTHAGFVPGTGLANGTCYRAVVSDCPEATGDFAAAVKINEPANLSQVRGTVFFTTGGGGNALYDYDSEFEGDTRCAGSNCGLLVVQQINADNYRTVQIDFSDPDQLISEPYGWLPARRPMARGRWRAAMPPWFTRCGQLFSTATRLTPCAPPAIAVEARSSLTR